MLYNYTYLYMQYRSRFIINFVLLLFLHCWLRTLLIYIMQTIIIIFAIVWFVNIQLYNLFIDTYIYISVKTYYSVYNILFILYFSLLLVHNMKNTYTYISLPINMLIHVSIFMP